MAAATSSIPQIDTVDSTNGTPAASAARAACTSARWANMPPSPTGPRITGMSSCSPSTSTDCRRSVTSTITRWRRWIDSRSSTLARSVSSSEAPPSM
ncbi:MAG: hypothetical protein R2746_17850 [Acidimicrobiales bacterium]